MKARFLPLVLIAAVLLAFGALAAACGDDDGEELTLEEYFQRLEELSAEFDDEGNALDADKEGRFESAASEDEQVDVFREFLDEALARSRDFVNDLDDLNPPAAAAVAHEDAVEAGRNVVELFESAIVVAEDAESFADAAALLEAPGFTEASDRFTDSCLALEELAAGNDIVVDLRCG